MRAVFPAMLRSGPYPVFHEPGFLLKLFDRVGELEELFAAVAALAGERCRGGIRFACGAGGRVF